MFGPLKHRLVRTAVTLNNLAVRLLPPRQSPRCGMVQLDEVVQRASRGTDISDHLLTLFTEALGAEPILIVELGVRGGESTFVLERVAALTNAVMVSVDIEPFDGRSPYPRWTFVQSDDIAFADAFPEWCAQQGVEPRVDVLFIDTSHLYEHTLQEIRAWLPLLSDRGCVFFHDTNIARIYRRSDGTMGSGGWSERRGVISALESHFGCRFNEKTDFVDVRGGFLIRHYARCNGFTVLRRLQAVASEESEPAVDEADAAAGEASSHDAAATGR